MCSLVERQIRICSCDHFLFVALAPSHQTRHTFRFSPIAIRLCFFTALFLLCFAAGSRAEILTGEGTILKKVTILKQPVSDHDQPEKKTGKTFFVEEVTDLPGLKKGLSLRDSMPEDHGMLFVLDASQELAFWMKGMRFPLDIIFIGKKMQVSEILENLQPCEKCPMYFPKGRPAYAVEINAGLAKKLGITIGDTLVIEK